MILSMQMQKRAIMAGGRVYSQEMSGKRRYPVLTLLKGKALKKGTTQEVVEAPVGNAVGASTSHRLPAEEDFEPTEEEEFWARTNSTLEHTRCSRFMTGTHLIFVVQWHWCHQRLNSGLQQHCTALTTSRWSS
jgi:hypothetical protein